jgi:hypothetical protein
VALHTVALLRAGNDTRQYRALLYSLQEPATPPGAGEGHETSSSHRKKVTYETSFNKGH